MKKNRFLILSLFILCCSFVKAGYSDEYPSAYTRAFNNGITTQPTIDKANMNKSVTRIELSKMISNYAINILNKKPDTSKKCEFSDILDNLNTQYDLGVTKACQLGLMGQGIIKFRPNDKVTRAEFGTILSRLLYGDKYNGGTPYYNKHLNQLNIRGIMTNIKNPQGMELRGNVMVMLKRSQELGNYKIPSFDELDDIIYDKCPNGFEGSYDIVYRNSFIIPYKDGYIGYNYGGQEGLGIYLTYKDINNPCNDIAQSDTIFWYGEYVEDETHPLTNVYTSIGNRSSWRTEEIVKRLNCTPNKGGFYGTTWNDCEKELNRYMYNLIIGEENNEHFTQRMNKFKQDINNNNFTNYNFRQKRGRDCDNKIDKELDQLKNSLDGEEIEKLRYKKEYECAIEYLKN